MPSITTWRQLEPVSRSETMTALSARVANPLWMIGRQWQVGELSGSDSGSPIASWIKVETSRVTRWASLDAPGGPGDPLPDGCVVESFIDVVAPRVGLMDRARGGLHFLRLLGALGPTYLAGFREHYPLKLLDNDRDKIDDRSARIADLLIGRAFDGGSLRSHIGPADNPNLPPKPEINSLHEDAVLNAAGLFALWWDERYQTPAGAWKPQRLGAPFRLGFEASAGPVSLMAPEHRGRQIDWYSFDVATGVASGDRASTVPTEAMQSLPARFSFPGMPRPRWWEFEDAAVDLSKLDAAPDDLGRLLLAEFALLYGNDFFAVPVSVPVGSVCRVVSLEVDTCFGDTIAIPSAQSHDRSMGSEDWRMFANDNVPEGGVAEVGLILPPTAVGDLRGRPREEVLIARDEMANVAWAIELKVTGPTGTVVERREAEEAKRKRSGAETAGRNAPRYRLSTTVPESWFALAPTLDGALTLQGDRHPIGQLMGGTTPFKLDAIEVPRVGRRATLAARRARLADGAVLQWMAWHVGPGRGESSSGLRHDELTLDEEASS